MRTLKQTLASRANSLKSTGPQTAEGKSHSSMNAYKTGIDAQTAILPDENAADYDATIAKWHTFYRPTSPATQVIIDRLASADWMYRRYDLAAVKILAPDLATVTPAEAWGKHAPKLARLQVHINALNRNFHRDLNQLTFLQANPDLDVPGEPQSSTAQPAESTTDNPSPASFLKNDPPASETPESSIGQTDDPTPTDPQSSTDPAESTTDDPPPASFLKSDPPASEAPEFSSGHPDDPTPTTPQSPTDQPAESPPDNPSPASFLKNDSPDPAQLAREAEYRRKNGIRPEHPLHPKDCPACSVRGYIGHGCRYDPNHPEETRWQSEKELGQWTRFDRP